MRRLPIAPVAALALSLAGCSAPEGNFPSLAPRPIEQRSEAETPAPPVVAAPDAALDVRVAELQAALAAADKAFAPAAATARRLAPAARTVGSEAWVEAQTALSTAGTARGATAEALADMERLAIDRAAAGQPPYPALESALAAARAQADAQSAAYDTLAATLPTG